MSDDKDSYSPSHETETPPESAAHAHDEGPPPSEETLNRRRFLARGSIAAGAACGAALAVPMVGFVLGPLISKPPPEWQRVIRSETKSIEGTRASGNEFMLAKDFIVGETIAVIFRDASPVAWAGVTANTAAWVKRETTDDPAKMFTVFKVNCAHLGCPVRWLPDARLFMCPCHGGVYYADGTVAAGPPPHPLRQHNWKVDDEGYFLIETAPIPVD